jgi:hypothetical protein
MKIGHSAGEKGLIKMILIIVIAILVLSYFGVNLRALVSSPTTQDNISYVASGTVTVWDNYLKVPATALWHFFLTYVWSAAVTAIKNGSVSVPTTELPTSFASSTSGMLGQ